MLMLITALSGLHMVSMADMSVFAVELVLGIALGIGLSDG